MSGNEAESSDDLRGPLGLTLLHEPPEPLIDFIFVHGLRGGSRKTWSQTESPTHYWPKEWLPLEPGFKNVRIHSFGYNSDWGERKGSSLTIHDFGQALLGDMQNAPSLTGASNKVTPLVMIGHSMGGVVIKKTLLLARQDPSHHKIASRIHSMFFLATPHRGADSAQLLSNMLKIAVSYGSKPYVDSLVPHSDAIQVINDGFRHAYQGIQLWSFFETVKTSVGLIVEKDSAILDLPGERVQLLNADHRHVCKFEDPSDSNYCTLRNAFISTINSIKITWLSAKQEDHQQDMRILSSYLGLSETPEADLANVVDFQTEGSCGWLTGKTSFLDWQLSVNDYPKCFWLSGEPATGKSTLSGHVIKHLEESNSDCSYFFFKHGGVGKSTVAELLCSLAWQMASSNTEIRRKILSLHEEGVLIDKSDERSVWRTIFIARIFRTELRQPHYWIIDGLDESANYAAFFPLLGKVDQHFPLRVFVASRPHLAIERSFSQENILNVHESVSRDNSLSDIKIFIDAHSHYLPVDTEAARNELVELILQKSNGNFLWTKLVIKELEEALSQQRVDEILETVPQGIYQLYSRILSNLVVSPGNCELVMSLLRWVVCAARPLTVEELREALRLDIGEVLPQLDRTAGSICGNLIYVDSQTKVRSAHHTVQEYLFHADGDSRYAINRPEAHSRIAAVCLKYLSGDEMRSARYRRGGSTVRQRTRSAFAAYSVKYFSHHIARSKSSADEQLLGLNKFLQANALTWIEMIGMSQDLGSLTQTAKDFKTYLERRAKYRSPLGVEVQNVSEWTNDLIRLVAQFGKTLISSPSAVQYLIPPVCPPDSIIHKTFGKIPRGLQLEGLSQRYWDDRLCCIIFSGAQTLSAAWCDNKFALGLSDGTVHVYDETSFQRQLRLSHGEPVRCLNYATTNLYLASASRKRLSLWNTSTGSQLWTTTLADQALALEFDEDDSILMAATRANTMCFWEVRTGQVLDESHFSDIDEEDRSEYHYKRSPLRARFAPGLRLLGVAYRQRPISFWDLEDNTFIGQYHKAGSVYPEPRILDFIFNPKAEISLAAVAYDSRDVAVFDPWTQQTHAIVDADASALAASSDGTVLATGSGDGVIKLYEFETLKLMFQINSHQEDIRIMVFNSTNLRFLDIRSNHCNVWEPSVLVRRIGPGDDSSLDFSESMIESPKYSASRMSDDDLAITALTFHDSGEYVFCGRENGSVASYSCKSGQLISEAFSHSKNVAISTLEWNQPESLLAICDRSGDVAVRKLSKNALGILSFDGPLLRQKSSSVVHQIIFHPQGSRILVSTEEAEQLWCLEEASLMKTLTPLEGRSSGKWMSHPKQADLLIFVDATRARIYNWETLKEISALEGIDLEVPLGTPFPLSCLVTSIRGHNLCAVSLGAKTTGFAPALRLWPTSLLVPEAKNVKLTACFDQLAQDIKSVVGIHKSILIFLAHSGWVCSINIDDVSQEEFYTRHFFIPLQWHSTRENLSISVTCKGSIVMAMNHEIAIFHNGLDFEDRVGFAGAMVSGKLSMRSVLKRGTSNPL